MVRILVLVLALAVSVQAGVLLTQPPDVDFPQVQGIFSGSVNPIMVWVIYPDVDVLGDFAVDRPGLFGDLGYFDIEFVSPNQIRFENFRAEQPLTLTLVGLFVDPFRGYLMGRTVFHSPLVSGDLPGAESVLGAHLYRGGVPTSVYGEASLSLEGYTGGAATIDADLSHVGVPEPATMLLGGLGLGIMGWWKRRHSNAMSRYAQKCAHSLHRRITIR